MYRYSMSERIFFLYCLNIYTYIIYTYIYRKIHEALYTERIETRTVSQTLAKSSEAYQNIESKTCLYGTRCGRTCACT